MPFKHVHLSKPIVFITFAVKSGRMKKVLYFVFLCSFLLTACSQKKKYKIGVSQCSEDIWREKLNDEILNSAYLYDNLKIEIASANESDKQQVAQIDKFVKDGVDLLIVSPNKQSTITPAIVRAYKKGIPVILFDHKINADQYTSYIGADNVNIGREMGNFLARKTGGKARIVEITGLPGSTSASERHKGFVEALKNYPGMKIVQQRRGDWQPKSARIAMDSVLRWTSTACLPTMTVWPLRRATSWKNTASTGTLRISASTDCPCRAAVWTTCATAVSPPATSTPPVAIWWYSSP